MTSEFWKNKTVLVTGHTGFKGAWLSIWLSQLGAAVVGVSDGIVSKPSLYVEAQVSSRIKRECFFDIANEDDGLRELIFEEKPDVVFHFAAQSLVIAGYHQPVKTFRVNVVGTAELIESCRLSSAPAVVIVATTDKCYVNREWIWAYRENDTLGGRDPYSASKAGAELVVEAFNKSYDLPFKLHSVRAGNVIGGGDWAKNRIVPDVIAAFLEGKKLELRNPEAIRPWQHVLEPLNGYMRLAERLHDRFAGAADFTSWNFGPDPQNEITVQDLVNRMSEAWGIAIATNQRGQKRHEAHYLRLDSSLARARLGWKTVWGINESIRSTAAWYRKFSDGANAHDLVINDIERFTSDATEGV